MVTATTTNQLPHSALCGELWNDQRVHGCWLLLQLTTAAITPTTHQLILAVDMKLC